MIPIYIFGNDEDETLGQIIKKAISPFGTTVYNTDKHSDEINDTCSFFMKEQEDCSNLKNSVGIAVFKKSFLPKEPVILPANWIAVIDSNHDKLKEQFCKTGQIVVTCGTKATDTFSISVSYTHLYWTTPIKLPFTMQNVTVWAFAFYRLM